MAFGLIKTQEVTYLSGSSTGPSKVKVCVQAREWPCLNIAASRVFSNGMKLMARGMFGICFGGEMGVS